MRTRVYRKEGSAAVSDDHSPDETFMCLERADALVFGKIPHFDLRKGHQNNENPQTIGALLENMSVLSPQNIKKNVYLAITGAREHGGETPGVLGQTVHPISVAVQGGQERLGKHALQLSGIQGPSVFSAHLERMEGGVIVPGD